MTRNRIGSESEIATKPARLLCLAYLRLSPRCGANGVQPMVDRGETTTFRMCFLTRAALMWFGRTPLAKSPLQDYCGKAQRVYRDCNTAVPSLQRIALAFQ